jgi:hypothetical protein
MITTVLEFFTTMSKGVLAFLTGKCSLAALYAFFILVLYAYSPTAYATYDLSLTVATLATREAIHDTILLPIEMFQ